MNVANLQLEGVLLALSSVLRSLVQTGALSEEQLGSALSDAERLGLADRMGQLSPSQREALVFAPRFLAIAMQSETPPTFSEVAKQVGRGRDD
jgi:N-acetylglucosamine-6-phosphate deacetylase